MKTTGSHGRHMGHQRDNTDSIQPGGRRAIRTRRLPRARERPLSKAETGAYKADASILAESALQGRRSEQALTSKAKAIGKDVNEPIRAHVRPYG